MGRIVITAKPRSECCDDGSYGDCVYDCAKVRWDRETIIRELNEMKSYLDRYLLEGQQGKYLTLDPIYNRIAMLRMALEDAE